MSYSYTPFTFKFSDSVHSLAAAQFIQADMESLGEEEQASRVTDIDDLVRRCDLSKEMQVVIGYYIMMEEYYMREMAGKAAALDSSDTDSLTSSVVDDTFYLVKKSIRYKTADLRRASEPHHLHFSNDCIYFAKFNICNNYFAFSCKNY